MKVANSHLAQVAVETITPASASRYLLMNTRNRALRPTVVARYARDMAEGNWDLNGETLKLAVDGEIIDGQHRLRAIIESGVSIPMVVISGLDNRVQDTIDRGLPRNIADALRLHGEVSCTVLAATISQVIVLKSPNPSDTHAWPSTREALAYLEAHPQVRDAVNRGEVLRKALRVRASVAAALFHLFSEVDEEDADAFFASLASGVDLAGDSPILRLRETLVREMSAPRQMERRRLHALWIKAWNAWRRGTPMLLLKWKTGGATPEAFPRPE